MIHAEVAGTGMYVPERVMSNQDLEKMVNTSDSWIRARTGIVERRIAADDEAPSDLAVKASRQALKNAGLDARELGMIIVCTSTPDVLFPSTACFVQDKLNAAPAAAFDVSAVCSGFVFGLSVAEQFVKSGRYEHVLVVGAEVNSRFIDWKDRSTCVIFGDGAGAVILKKTQSDYPRGILSTHIYSDGGKADLIGIPGGIGKTGINQTAIADNLYVLKMNGGPTFKLAIQRMTEVAHEALEHNGFSLKDVSLVIPHQANTRIIDAVSEKMGIRRDRIMINIQKYGNTSAASIPIALHEAIEDDRIHKGDLVLLTVLGAGLTWGAGLIRW